jgi:putative flippase GtrA
LEGLEPLRLPNSQIGPVGNVKTVLREATRYVSVSACAFIINIAVLFVLVRYLSWWYVAAGVHYLIAKCGAAGFTFVWSFVARRQFLFAQRRAA